MNENGGEPFSNLRISSTERIEIEIEMKTKVGVEKEIEDAGTAR